MKKIKTLLIALILVLGGVFFSSTYAATRELGAQLNRPFTNSKYQYLVPSNTTDVKYTVVKIYDNADKIDSELAFAKVLYCLRGGKGFGANVQENGTDISTTPITYNELGEMHTDAKTVIEKYNELYGVNLDRNETINNKEINIYNAILWVLDESYLPTDKTNSENIKIYDETEYKRELLDKAGIPYTQQSSITKDDIEVIQQLAIWYFANYDEQSAGTKPTVSQATKFPAQFLSINGDNNIDSRREENLNRLYQYLIYGAIDNSDSYTIDETTNARTKVVEKNEFDKTTALEISSVNISAPGTQIGPESYYKIGPIKIKNDVNTRTGEKTVDATSIVLYDAEGNSIDKIFEIPEEDQQTGETISGGNHVIYEFIDETGNPVTQLEKGNTYYIKFKKAFEKGSTVIPYITENEQYDVSKVKVKIISSYSLSTANFLYKENTDQAVVEIEKEKISEEDEITTQSFDLVLRKFITSITRNGANVEVADRTPSIDLSKLNTTDSRTNKKITTATYTHPKNALLVETNDKVIYTIRIYNEGELDGTATEVTDYLPTGLELVPASESTINTTYGWVSSSDGRTITTEYLKDTTIKAYDSTKTSLTTGETGWQKAETGDSGLYYADVQVECKVVAEVGAQDQSLRNIAEISEDSGEDRDSVPDNVNTNSYTPPADNSTYQEDDDDYEDLVLKAKSFDLSLRKFITKVERVNKETQEKEELDIVSREPVIEIKGLKNGDDTARYVHPKNTISLKRGDIITYTIRVYNEGDLNGYATEVKDYLPDGLELVEGENDIWTVDGNTLTTDALKDKLLLGYDRELETAPEGVNWQKASDDETGLYYYDLTVVCKIKSDVTDGTVLKNVAEISSDKSEPTDIDDRDSVPGNLYEDNNHTPGIEVDGYTPGEQDDDDFESVKVEPDQVFDLALRKYISSIKRNGSEVEFDDRTPKINTETLIKGTFDRNGELEYTATYEHSKEPLVVKQGDIITYTLRIYNEGERDGYASEITDYIPEGLALIENYNTNFDNAWELSQDLDSDQIMKLVGEDGFYKTEEDVKNLKLEDFSNMNITSLKEVNLITGKAEITTKELDDKLIKAFDKDKTLEEEGWQKAETGDGGLYYKDVRVSFLVIAPNTCKDVLTNIAEISDDRDENGNPVDDRDSTPDNQATRNEDDDDYEPVVLKYFDLALRKFITGVETNGKTTDITSRIPSLSINEETGNIKYTHPKEEAPVAVANNDIVIYTLRVYNEGTIAGYAEEITDDIPEGLEYLPEHNINKEYEWVMIDKDGNVTDKLEEAQSIKTEYLSEVKEKSENRDNLIDPFDSSKAISTEEPFNPDYKDVKVAFKVTEPNTSDRIIVNSAQISEDSDDDEDSIPNEWNEGEDDQDKEYIYVKYFDLSLLKWVTKTIVTVDGKTTTTETGFEPNTGKTETTGIRDNEEKEPIAKVELDRKKLNKTTVKFVYKIRITNEGEIEGYATEVTDYIPEGLEFKAEDNKAYGWIKEGENKVTTRALETVLLKPGESTELEIVFTWKNDSKNLGVKTNVAEIREDYNEHNSKDIDSTPGNKKDPYEKEQEDDDDFALVILSLKTGKGMSYTLLITTVVTLLAGGIYLIKKYVLTY